MWLNSSSEKAKVTVENVDEFALQHPYWIVKVNDGDTTVWYESEWDSYEKAEQIIRDELNNNGVSHYFIVENK